MTHPSKAPGPCSALVLAALLWSTGAGCAGCAGGPADPRAAAFAAEMQAAFDRGDLRGALALADSADRYAPGQPAVDYTRGLVFNRFRRYADARQAFARVLERDPGFPGAAYHLGHTAFLQRQFREALGHYTRERALVARRRAAPGADPRALPTITAQIGRTYEKLGVADSARRAYEDALAADSSLAVAHAWLSELYETEGRIDEAFVHARKALHARPQETEYVYRVGSLYLQKGYPEAAVPILERVVRRWPGHEGATYNLGRALLALGQQAEGQLFLDRVAAVQRLQEEALVAERGVETHPTDPQRWITLGGLMLRSGYLDKAEEAFTAALFLKPGERSVQNDLANLAFARGDTAAAFQRFDALLRQDSTFADGWLNLGILYARTGRRDAARTAWQRALRHHPGDPQARAYLASLGG